MIENFNISIQVVNGGFILNYDKIDESSDKATVAYVTEVVVSQRKLLQKIKDIVVNLSSTSDTAD